MVHSVTLEDDLSELTEEAFVKYLGLNEVKILAPVLDFKAENEDADESIACKWLQPSFYSVSVQGIFCKKDSLIS